MTTESSVTSQVYFLSALRGVPLAETTAVQSGKTGCMVMALGGSISLGYKAPSVHDHAFPVSGALVCSVASLPAVIVILSEDEITTQLVVVVVAVSPHTPSALFSASL